MLEFIKQLFAVQSKDAEAKQIAKHLSQVLLYELKENDTLYPDLKLKFKQLVERMKVLKKPIWLVEGFRSAKKQDNYYAQGRTDSNLVITNAKGLESWHQYCLAFDVAFVEGNWAVPNNWWTILGREGKKLGLKWGGDFGDNGHFQLDVPNLEWSTLEDYFTMDKPSYTVDN